MPSGGSVLHLCADFARQRVYTQLVSSLRRQRIHQVVYAAVRTQREAEWTAPELAGVSHYLRRILAPQHRLLFRSKVRRVARDLVEQVDLSTVRVVHAHFLYSDGAVALRLHEARGLPYIVAVRNTDLNAFMKYRPDLAGVRDRILARASRVVFLSKAYQQALERRLGNAMREVVARKSVVIPNGLALEWLEPPPSPVNATNDLRLLYVGDFSHNKNIPRMLQGVRLLAATRPVRLTLVGGGGDGSAEVAKLLASAKYPFATHLGRIDDSVALRDVYRNNDVFLMPSLLETFGVVYLEALSQGLPIAHSCGQGVDGYFAPGTVAEAVNPRDPSDIATKVAALAGRLPAVRELCIREAGRFDWRRVAQAYSDLYSAVVREAEASLP